MFSTDDRTTDSDRERAELARASAADDFASLRMTSGQYAELVQVACRAELARARTRGLHLSRDAYAEMFAEMYAAVALAGLERAQSIDRAAGMTWTARDGFAPRWAGIYAEQHAEQTSGAEWSELHGADRAQLARNRWVQWLRFTARHEVGELAQRAEVEAGTEPTYLAESMPAARLATGEALAAALSERLATVGEPLGVLESAAVAACLSGLTHGQRAELTGSTADACKTYAAKGRKALRARWITADALRVDLAAADRAADLADLDAASVRMAPLGADAAMVARTRAEMVRAERAETAEQVRAQSRKNVERAQSGHAGGVVRSIVHVAADGEGTREQSSAVEAGGRANVSHAIHRAGTGTRQDRYARLFAAAQSAAHAATRHAVEGSDQRADRERQTVRALLGAAPATPSAQLAAA